MGQHRPGWEMKVPVTVTWARQRPGKGRALRQHAWPRGLSSIPGLRALATAARFSEHHETPLNPILVREKARLDVSLDDGAIPAPDSECGGHLASQLSLRQCHCPAEVLGVLEGRPPNRAQLGFRPCQQPTGGGVGSEDSAIWRADQDGNGDVVEERTEIGIAQPGLRPAITSGYRKPGIRVRHPAPPGPLRGHNVDERGRGLN